MPTGMNTPGTDFSKRKLPLHVSLEPVDIFVLWICDEGNCVVVCCDGGGETVYVAPETAGVVV